MTTVADIEGRELTPLSALLAAADVPGDLVTLDGELAALLDKALFTDAALRPVENGYLGSIVLVLAQEVALRPFGEAVQLILAGAGELTVCDVELSLEARSGGFAVALGLLDVAVGLRVDGSILRPLLPDSSEPDPSASGLDVALGSVGLRLATERPVAVELEAGPALPRCMIGETGVIVAAGGVGWLMPGSESLPAGTPEGFTGLHLDDVVVELAALDLSGDPAGGRRGLPRPRRSHGHGRARRPRALRVAGRVRPHAALARGHARPERGDRLRHRRHAAGPVLRPPVDVALSLSSDGGVQVTLAQSGPEAVVDLAVPGLGTFHLAALTLRVGGPEAALLLSGVLEVTVGAPGLQWPDVGIEALGIDTEGRVTIAGGWLDLQQPLALDLYGFGMEITRAGFGTEEDGRRWFGVDGAIRLTELLPAGASARGLRVISDPDEPQAPPALALEGVGVFFGVPDAFGFEGEVALADDPATGAKLFTGALSLGLDALDIGVDAGIAIGHDASVTYVFVHLGVAVPIPVAATGTALYGLEGLFAMNMSPRVTHADVPLGDGTTVERGDWYGWYRDVPDIFSVTDPFKWSPDPGAWAFGAGLSLGTLPDAGFSVNTNLAARLSYPALACPVRGLELVLYAQEDLDDPLGPAFQLTLNTGPHMAQHVAYDPSEDPRFWFVLDVAIGRDTGRALAGPPPVEVFPELPVPLVVDSLQQALGAWVGSGLPRVVAPGSELLALWREQIGVQAVVAGLRTLLGRARPPEWVSRGGDQGRCSVAVQLEEVVDGAAQAPLILGGRFSS